MWLNCSENNISIQRYEGLKAHIIGDRLDSYQVHRDQVIRNCSRYKHILQFGFETIQSCLGHIFVVFWAYIRHLLCIYWENHGNTLVKYWAYLEHILAIYWFVFFDFSCFVFFMFSRPGRFCWRGWFCLLVELHREGSALQPAQQACFSAIKAIWEVYIK